jgi:PKD repeat protein
VTFTDLSSEEPTSWLWDFGDGAFSTVANPVHEFAGNGTYLVCLTVIGPGGADTYCDNLDIEYAELAPVADFTWSESGVLTISFTDLSINEPESWSWNFGDGTLSSLQNPIHTYATAGNYNVCLTAGNDIGSHTSCEIIGVTDIVSQGLPVLYAYPNPSSGIVTIQTGQLKNYSVRLYNAIGQQVTPQGYTTLASGIRMDISNLAPGYYWFLIISEAGSLKCEFMKG